MVFQNRWAEQPPPGLLQALVTTRIESDKPHAAKHPELASRTGSDDRNETQDREPARKGLLLVYTGQGKGKTTAALGIVFRALGRGLRVAVVQFIKGKWRTGERLFAETIPGLTFLVMGRGFTWESDDLARDRNAAVEAWTKAKELIAGGEHAVVVLDEMTYVINYGFIALTEVLAVLRDRPAHVHVVVTGRMAQEELCALADLVTEMKPVKHPFALGVKAQPGLDY